METHQSIKRRTIIALAVIGECFAVNAFLPARAAAVEPEALSPEKVDQAIDKAKAYLYSKMHDDNWEEFPAREPKGPANKVNGGQWGGLTAIATYALLAAGESPQDPRLIKAIGFLEKADMIGIYAVGLRCQVWNLIPKDQLVQAAIVRDARALLLAKHIKGADVGLYGYIPEPSGAGDHSTSQYGVLGMWACADALQDVDFKGGPQIEIPEAYWNEEDQVWRRGQGEDGSWEYHAAPPGTITRSTKKAAKPGEKPVVTETTVKGTVSMTAAGLATLFITQDYLDRGRGVSCSGNIEDPNLSRGLKWFDDSLKGNGLNSLTGYGFYGLERVGVASGYKYFGDTDWFESGAADLIHRQKADGSFPADISPVLANTAFALLFLSRGRAPVMFNKLNYTLAGKLGNWDERPRDIANLVHWVGRETENTLNWQSTTFSSPVAQWHDAPILYIAGDQALAFTPEEKDKLKQFIQQGGLIVGNADCGNEEFATSFRKLGNELFADYEFQPLSKSSVILHDEQYSAAKFRHPLNVLAMSNGSRQLMLLIPQADPSRAWQLQETSGHEEMFQLGADIFLYSVDKDQMTAKGDTHIIFPDKKIKATKTIDVDLIKYEGNYDPEPGGWWRLDAKMHNQYRVDVKTKVVTPQELAGKTVAHLTGTESFKLSDADVAAIRKFCDGGGTLVVDACGGNADFADSAEKALTAIFGDDASQLKIPLPTDSPLYSAGGPLGTVGYRTYARSMIGRLHGPQLRGIKQGGSKQADRLVCIFSREDLSTGMVGEPVDGIIGYSPDTATELMEKILLYASNTKATPTGTGAAKPPAAKKAEKKPIAQ